MECVIKLSTTLQTIIHAFKAFLVFFLYVLYGDTSMHTCVWIIVLTLSVSKVRKKKENWSVEIHYYIFSIFLNLLYSEIYSMQFHSF